MPNMSDQNISDQLLFLNTIRWFRIRVYYEYTG